MLSTYRHHVLEVSPTCTCESGASFCPHFTEEETEGLRGKSPPSLNEAGTSEPWDATAKSPLSHVTSSYALVPAPLLILGWIIWNCHFDRPKEVTYPLHMVQTNNSCPLPGMPAPSTDPSHPSGRFLFLHLLQGLPTPCRLTEMHSFVRSATTENHWLGCLNSRHLFAHSSGGLQSGIKELAGLVLLRLPSLLCL